MSCRSHKHPLCYIQRPYGLRPWRCDQCHCLFDSCEFTNHCSKCRYDVCNSCIRRYPIPLVPVLQPRPTIIYPSPTYYYPQPSQYLVQSPASLPPPPPPQYTTVYNQYPYAQMPNQPPVTNNNYPVPPSTNIDGQSSSKPQLPTYVTEEALEILEGMGFSNQLHNIYLLQKHRGDLNAAVAELLG